MVTRSKRIKQPGREDDHTLPSITEVKNAWSCNSAPPYALKVWCLIKNRWIHTKGFQHSFFSNSNYNLNLFFVGKFIFRLSTIRDTEGNNWIPSWRISRVCKAGSRLLVLGVVARSYVNAPTSADTSSTSHTSPGPTVVGKYEPEHQRE
jgi:hypothetical protein